MHATEALRRAVRTVPDFPQPGIQFRDITPLLIEPQLIHAAVEALAAPFLAAGVTRVMGIEARGFILGAMLAHRLGAGFVPVRKKGKLPYETVAAAYELEYGIDTIEMHVDALGPADRVLVHDDVIATGGTARAAGELARTVGATVVGYTFLVEIEGLAGRSLLTDRVPVHAVLPF